MRNIGRSQAILSMTCLMGTFLFAGVCAGADDYEIIRFPSVFRKSAVIRSQAQLDDFAKDQVRQHDTSGAFEKQMNALKIDFEKNVLALLVHVENNPTKITFSKPERLKDKTLAIGITTDREPYPDVVKPHYTCYAVIVPKDIEQLELRRERVKPVRFSLFPAEK